MWWGLLPGDKNTWKWGHSLTPEWFESGAIEPTKEYGMLFLEVPQSALGK
ncbi:MAG TPA: hypothetical protein ACFYD3_08290 [Candidatus Hypogeohydataceae bacterium YC41]